MGRSNRKPAAKSHTLPSSPTHSSSSSDFEFATSLSPRKALCPADELFYKGQLLPLHLSPPPPPPPPPRLSMVRTLLLSSASTSSSSDTATTASRDSTASHSSSDSSSTDLLPHIFCDSSRPSSAAAADSILSLTYHRRKGSRYFSLPRFSSVFRRDNNNNNKPALEEPPPAAAAAAAASAVKRVSSSAKEVICRYLKKVRPLYERLSHKQQKMSPTPAPASATRSANNADLEQSIDYSKESGSRNIYSQSFSGNLRYPRRRSCVVSSCPSSMMSSPRHVGSGLEESGRVGFDSEASSMEELQSAIQGAIAHCKNSMTMKNKNILYG